MFITGGEFYLVLISEIRPKSLNPNFLISKAPNFRINSELRSRHCAVVLATFQVAATVAKIKDLLPKALSHLKSRIVSQLQSAASSPSISVHAWRPTKEETGTLVAVTAHFIDNTLRPAKVLLGVEALSDDNLNAQSLKALVDTLLESHGINNEQVFAYVTNNLSNFSVEISSWERGTCHL